MAKKYTVELTDAQDKALAHVAYSVQEWIDNAAHVRANQARNEVYDNEVKRMTDDPDIDTIPADKDQVILDADIKTAKETQDELDNA